MALQVSKNSDLTISENGIEPANSLNQIGLTIYNWMCGTQLVGNNHATSQLYMVYNGAFIHGLWYYDTGWETAHQRCSSRQRKVDTNNPKMGQDGTSTNPYWC